MALFDNDFMDSIVTEGKDCDKDCKKDKDVDEEKDEKEEDLDEDLSDDDAEEAEEAAQFDVEEASSIEEMKGIAHPLTEMVTDTTFACLEMMGTSIALDRADVACTESYVTASSIAEKEAVTEGFKETVKKFYQKFKAFIIKIKNIIVRAYNRIKNYVVNLFTKIAKKVVMWKVKELDTKKMKDSKNTIKIYEKVTGTLESLLDDPKEMKAGLKEATDCIMKIKNSTSQSDIDEAKNIAAELAKMDKDSIRKQMLGIQREVPVTEFSDALSDLKGMKVPKAFDRNRKTVLDVIKKCEDGVKNDKNLNSQTMSVRVTLINNITSMLNKVWAVMGTLVHHWVAPRVAIVAKYGKREFFGSDDKEKKGGKKAKAAEADTSSWNILDGFDDIVM